MGRADRPEVPHNFTDPRSRIMPKGANRGSFVQACNFPAMIAEKSQIIVTAEVTQAPQGQGSCSR